MKVSPHLSLDRCTFQQTRRKSGSAWRSSRPLLNHWRIRRRLANRNDTRVCLFQPSCVFLLIAFTPIIIGELNGNYSSSSSLRQPRTQNVDLLASSSGWHGLSIANSLVGVRGELADETKTPIVPRARASVEISARTQRQCYVSLNTRNASRCCPT